MELGRAKTGLQVHAVIWIFALSMAGLVARSALHSGAFYFLLYNADALYIPAFINDLIRHPQTLSGWRFSPAPNFFPDMPIYAASLLAGGEFRAAIIVYVALQTGLFLEACRGLARSAGLRSVTFIVILLLAVCFCRFFIEAAANPPVNAIFWLAPMVAPGCHFGAILGSVWGLGLLVTALKGSRRAAAVLALLVIAVGLSDLFYPVWFCLPACVLLVFVRESRARPLGLAAMLGGLGIAIGAAQLAFNDTLSLYRAESIPVAKSAGFLIQYLFGSGLENALQAGIVMLAAVVLSVRAALLLIRVGESRALISAFLALSPLVSLAAGLFSGLLSTEAIPRYTLPVFYMTLLGLAVAAGDIRFPKWAALLPAAGALLLLGLLPDMRHYASRLPSPPQLGCFAKSQALAGLADYWSARTLTLFSGERLQVQALATDAKPVWWISNRDWYLRSFAEPDKMPLYSFIYMSRVDPAAAESLFGKPGRVEPCPGGEVWFYDDAEELTRRLRGAVAASGFAEP